MAQNTTTRMPRKNARVMLTAICEYEHCDNKFSYYSKKPQRFCSTKCIYEWKRGRKFPAISAGRTGVKASQEARLNMSNAQKKAIKEGRSIPPSLRGVKSMLGKKHSEETKAKMREAAKKRIMERPHTIPSHKGYKISDEAKAKMSKAKLGKYIGEKSNNWKGGRTPLRKKIRNLPQYKVWRTAVFERDNYTCRKCGDSGVVLNANHIIPFAFILDSYEIASTAQAINCVLLWDIRNGETLCEDCHKKTDSFGNSKSTKDYLPLKYLEERLCV